MSHWLAPGWQGTSAEKLEVSGAAFGQVPRNNPPSILHALCLGLVGHPDSPGNFHLSACPDPGS